MSGDVLAEYNKIIFSLLVQTDFEHMFHVIRLTAPPRVNLLIAEIMQEELAGGERDVFQHSHLQ